MPTKHAKQKIDPSQVNNPALASADQNKHALMATAITLDATGELPSRIPLFVTGDWPNSVKGNFSVDIDDLKQMKEHFEAGIGFPTEDASTGLAIDFSHNYADEAAAWFKGLELSVDPDDSTKGTLFAAPVEWTDTGAEAVRSGRFKCVSPMGSFGKKDGKLSLWANVNNLKEKLPNVLEGAGLTNIPFLREMPPIRADKLDDNASAYDTVIYVAQEQHKKENSMNLDALRVKEAEDLSGAEYKFIAENKSELSAEEQKKFSLEVPEAAAADQLSDEDRATLDALKSGDKKLVDSEAATVEKSRLDALEATATQYLDEKAQEIVDKHVTRGAIKQDAAENWKKRLLSATGEEREQLESDLAGLADNEMLAKTLGTSDETAAGNTPREQLNALANQKVAAAAKEGKELLYADALREAIRENADLTKADLQTNLAQAGA